MATEATETKQEAWPIPPVGAPCWIEVMSVDPPKLKEFYAGLFPAWEFIPATEEYKEDMVVMYKFNEPKGLSGGIVKLPEGCERAAQPLGIGFTVYFWVNDLEATEKRVHELGGTTVVGKKREGKTGWFMNFKDPEGNRFAAYTMDSSANCVE
ncbi:Glyoxalase/Bleomycin resistance protein/Dihydroxybiphenyl dioxygenase [Dendryphion nanum]|uniref:Glyoxalase/Bleomycin resistance protein/Dihydroxybiphenyl dioxygenase n=1 Tax=Dendryphion nanum TaxID=256645 RepID=A0A9P9D646_9PLEO|nr:Glyoxalase/Bleomycin resistance protein/Dihydroxybiphenyl dioxygenase [Dendryphion nanum]